MGSLAVGLELNRFGSGEVVSARQLHALSAADACI